MYQRLAWARKPISTIHHVLWDQFSSPFLVHTNTILTGCHQTAKFLHDLAWPLQAGLTAILSERQWCSLWLVIAMLIDISTVVKKTSNYIFLPYSLTMAGNPTPMEKHLTLKTSINAEKKFTRAKCVNWQSFENVFLCRKFHIFFNRFV